ncbi:MAG: HPr family phosphocarrier protein [Planctomycetota bacterium]|jgi:phosphotransferase system HPr (HPr) family protein
MVEEAVSPELVLANPHGFHALPAGKFVHLANEFPCEVFVSIDGGDEGNGKSMLDLCARAAEKGARIRIRTRGKDAKAALGALVDLVKGGFGEL